MGTTYKLFFGDPFHYTLHSKDYKRKPFLNLVISFNAKLNYPITYLLTLTYYLIYMPSILRLLNSDSFSRYFEKEYANPKWCAFCVVLLFKLFFLSSFYTILADTYLKASLLSFAFSWGALYVVFLIITLPLALAHYIQLGTKQAIKFINEQQNKNTIQICQEVKSLADLNSRLHYFNSVPLILFLVSNTIDELAIICRLSVLGIRLHMIIYFLVLFVYQLYLAYLSQQTVKMLRNIVKSAKKEAPNVKSHISYHSRSDLQHLLSFDKQLSLNIFSVINFNFIFVLELSLFVLQYSVFLLQTKEEN